jgi:enoyl-CoA hydratase
LSISLRITCKPIIYKPLIVVFLMERDYIELEVDDDITIMRMKREEKLNALNSEMFNEILVVLRRLNNDKGVKVVVLTGKGRAFSVGADITELYNLQSQSRVSSFLRLQREVNDFIEEMDKPVISAVNGYCLGGGLELALASDLILASRSSKFGSPEIKLGWIPGGGGTQRLTRIVGKQKAKELILTGKMIDAEEAFRIGIVNKVVDDEKLMEEAKELARAVSRASIAVSKAKELINLAGEGNLKAMLSYESEVSNLLLSTRDAMEGIKAFFERRKPVFRGE